MSNISSSLIPVDKLKIVKACANAIEWVHLERMKHFENEVQEAMEPRWNWFWLGKRTRTRAEAEKHVQNPPDDNDFCSTWRYYTYSYKYWNSSVIERAENLMSAVNICDGPVAYLTVSDAGFVQSHMGDKT